MVPQTHGCTDGCGGSGGGVDRLSMVARCGTRENLSGLPYLASNERPTMGDAAVHRIRNFLFFIFFLSVFP